MIKRYSNFILEKTIGSEEIRNKWYSDIDKSLYYKIINIDPTSVRKKDFSKPGKYSKWLLREFKKGNIKIEDINNEDLSKKLNYYLFIFSTGWWIKHKKTGLKNIVYNKNGQGTYVDTHNDILKYDFYTFFKVVESAVYKYEADTEKSKFDVVYVDGKVDILIPINFAASFETAKNTDWCSQSFMGFSSWNSKSIMFRILPINKKYDKLKITWSKGGGTWYLACSKYPEINGEGSPFDIIDGVENWLDKKEKLDKIYNDEYSQWRENSKKIEETMSIVSNDAKKYIEKYYIEYDKKV